MKKSFSETYSKAVDSQIDSTMAEIEKNLAAIKDKNRGKCSVFYFNPGQDYNCSIIYEMSNNPRLPMVI